MSKSQKTPREQLLPEIKPPAGSAAGQIPNLSADQVPALSSGLNPASTFTEASATHTSPGAPYPPVAARLLSDSYIFHWELQSFRPDLFFTIAVAICLGVGIAAGHPAAGMIAAGGAMTTGFGAKQNIDGSPLLPMIFVSLGMSASTFIGMVAGHEDYTLLIIASLFGFGYGMLSTRESGFSWVGQQCVVTLLVASAFPFSPKAAGVRAALIFAGGAVQLLCSAIILRGFTQLRTHLLELARYARAEEAAIKEAYLAAAQSLWHRKLGSALPYALRLAAVLAISTEVYRRLHFASGYWIPMTALLVMRPGIADTANRAVARTVGTLAGAALASIFLVHVHPPPTGLAALVVLFTWLSYSTLNVNYALFSVSLTSYIVFLLSLAQIPGAEIAHRRVVCTMVGGSLALAVRLIVLRHRRKQASGPGEDAGQQQAGRELPLQTRPP